MEVDDADEGGGMSSKEWVDGTLRAIGADGTSVVGQERQG